MKDEGREMRMRTGCVSFPGKAWKCHFGGASVDNAAEAEPPELHSWLKARNEKNEKNWKSFLPQK
jgi:hypothetical protein